MVIAPLKLPICLVTFLCFNGGSSLSSSSKSRGTHGPAKSATTKLCRIKKEMISGTSSWSRDLITENRRSFWQRTFQHVLIATAPATGFFTLGAPEGWAETMVTSVVDTSGKGSITGAPLARVATYPGLEYLEPIYELQLSLQALRRNLDQQQQQVKTSPPSSTVVLNRLNKFFSGGVLSERNYYAGLGVQYMNQMVYEPGELSEYIRLDKEARFNAMEDALNVLQALKNTLSALATNGDEQQQQQERQEREALNQAQAAVDSIQRWMDMVPLQDRQAVAALYMAARRVDANRNGQLEADELKQLSEPDRAVWTRRIALVGG